MDLNKNIPKYLVEKYNLVRLVVLTALFSLLFINIYQPYRSAGWIEEISYDGMIDPEIGYFVLSSLLVLLGMGVVAISRVILYRHCKKNKRTIALWGYLAWIAAEIVVMATAFVMLEYLLGFRASHTFSELLKKSFANTAWIILLPYSVLWLYFSWKDKDTRLKNIDAFYKGRGRGTAEPDAPSHMISFYDTKGDVKFSVKTTDLLYIKGADNYITIHYMDGDRVGTSMVRSTFKAIEDNLQDKGIVRCHRSYMVNKQHIKLIEKGKDGTYAVKLDTLTPTSIPVSKNYATAVFDLFSE